MAEISIIRLTEEPQQFVELLESASFFRSDFAMPICPLGRRYYGAVFAGKTVEQTFLVVGPKRQLYFSVECDITDGRLGRFGLPVELRPSSEIPARLQDAALSWTLEELFRIATTAGQSTFTIRDATPGPVLSLAGTRFLGRNAKPSIEFRAVADLTLGPEHLWRSIRRSYRSLINWGRREMRIASVDRGNPNHTLFEQYIALHQQASGRVTRDTSSWEIMYGAIVSGEGELILGYLGQDLVSGTMVFDVEDTTYYASGAYDRTRFDRGISHCPLYQAMLNSQSRNMRFFDVGQILGDSVASEKEMAIGHFKKGFTDRVVTNFLWSFSVNSSASAAQESDRHAD